MKKLLLSLLKDWYWDDSITLGIYLAVVVFVVVGIIAIFQPHEAKSYYLKGDMENGLKIGVVIDWQMDDYIQLDRSITYEGAIQMVKDLNSSLPNATK